MTLRRLFITGLVFSVALVLFVASAVFFEMPRKYLVKLLSVYPITIVIGMIQRVTIPDNDAECLENLTKLDVTFKPLSSFRNAQGCGAEYAIRLSKIGKISLTNSPFLTCSMAIQLAEFENIFLQPTARDILGSSIARINHFGTYNCRSMRQYKFIKSQHAFANAIDISEFVLEDGRKVNVAKDWKGAGKKTEFLREISSRSCSSFRVSISPNGDANHWNHFHWDTGLYRSCR